MLLCVPFRLRSLGIWKDVIKDITYFLEHKYEIGRKQANENGGFGIREK